MNGRRLLALVVAIMMLKHLGSEIYFSLELIYLFMIIVGVVYKNSGV